MNEIQNYLFDNISQLVGYDQMNSSFKTNHISEDNQSIYEIFIPGIKKENIKVCIENNYVVVKTTSNETTSNKKILRSEFNYCGLVRMEILDYRKS